jgi:hypothetical protein
VSSRPFPVLFQSKETLKMKSTTRLSVWVALAALLCFATGAFGQSTANTNVNGTGYSLLNSPPSFLAFGFGFGPGQGNHGGPGNGPGNGRGNGCNNDPWGNGCTAVPEGGTSLMYVLLAGLGCVGAMVLRSRREAARETR